MLFSIEQPSTLDTSIVYDLLWCHRPPATTSTGYHAQRRMRHGGGFGAELLLWIGFSYSNLRAPYTGTSGTPVRSQQINRQGEKLRFVSQSGAAAQNSAPSAVRPVRRQWRAGEGVRRPGSRTTLCNYDRRAICLAETGRARSYTCEQCLHEQQS